MTELEYLTNTYTFRSETSVVKIGENKFGKYIILDSTIFYPQGGGQPCDKGKIHIENNIFRVKNVRLDENGVVFHYGDFENAHIKNTPLENTLVSLEIDTNLRMQNAKNHSAGHLIDIAIKNVGLALESTKSYHFTPGSYIEYEGNIDMNNKDQIIQDVNSELQTLIFQDLKIIAEYSKNDISNPDSPAGKSYRFVYIEGYKQYGCGCGGTHINSSKEIENITIRKVRVKKGIIKVSYELT